MSVAFVVGPLVLTKENTYAIYYKSGGVCRRGTRALLLFWLYVTLIFNSFYKIKSQLINGSANILLKYYTGTRKTLIYQRKMF